MILVEVYVPSFHKEYDFELDENAKVGILIEEIAEMISQKEQCEISGDMEELMLCIPEKQSILSKNVSLQESGVHTGSRIMLV